MRILHRIRWLWWLFCPSLSPLGADFCGLLKCLMSSFFLLDRKMLSRLCRLVGLRDGRVVTVFLVCVYCCGATSFLQRVH